MHYALIRQLLPPSRRRGNGLRLFVKRLSLGGLMSIIGDRWHIVSLMVVAAVAATNAAVADDNSVVFEIGGAGEWETKTSASKFGPNFALEVTPIENWLEIELGVTPFQVSGATEWESDLLFKKPFELSSTADLMIGLGPTWTHSSRSDERANSAGGEVALDFMFWPKPHRGWYVEPSYGVAFDHGHGESVGVTVGLLFGLPK